MSPQVATSECGVRCRRPCARALDFPRPWEERGGRNRARGARGAWGGMGAMGPWGHGGRACHGGGSARQVGMFSWKNEKASACKGRGGASAPCRGPAILGWLVTRILAGCPCLLMTHHPHHTPRDLSSSPVPIMAAKPSRRDAIQKRLFEVRPACVPRVPCVFPGRACVLPPSCTGLQPPTAPTSLRGPHPRKSTPPPDP